MHRTLLACTLGLAAGVEAAAAAPPVVRTRYLMGTLCEIAAYGPRANKAITKAFEEIERLERIMSTYKENSELSLLNHKAQRAEVNAKISKDLWKILSLALEIGEKSGAAFDPTFASPQKSRGLDMVRMDRFTESVRLSPGTHIDLGGIGKGYALDAAAEKLRELGVRSAQLNFAGQILVLGSHPEKVFWPIEISHPSCTTASCIQSAFQLRIRAGSVSTSANSERPGHIVNPRTGKPVRRMESITVIAPDATQADAWSTALFVAGISKLPADFPGCAIELKPEGSEIKTTHRGKCHDYIETQENHDKKNQRICLGCDAGSLPSPRSALSGAGRRL